MRSDLLIIMAKYPTPGKVKTRLAAEIGAKRATALYRSWLETLAREFAEAPFDVEWRYTPRRAPFRRFVAQASSLRVRRGGKLEACPTVLPQPPGDLGQRMQRIFAESLARGYRRVVMIGTDAPQMDQRTVRRAYRLLRRHPAVFQPTHDGGYALIGLTAMLDLFSGIPWSTDRVMSETRGRLRSYRIAYAELPVTYDVDTAADLARLSAHVPQHCAGN